MANSRNSVKRPIQVYFSEEEKEAIKKHVESIVPKTNYSQFIREAICEKMRKAEHPEIFNQDQNLNQFVLDVIIKKIKELDRKQELILKNTNIINSMKETLKAIKLHVNKKRIISELEIILNLFKANKNKTLNLQKIMDMTGIDEDTVFETISVLVSDGRIKQVGRGFSFR
ncbi:MAG: hypothetical protein ACFFBP_21070 [Promethearchaeota archaeon]